MRAFCLAGEQVEAVWEDIASHFDAFERAGADLSASKAKERAKVSNLQIWGLQDERGVHHILTTEVIDTAQGLVCMVVMAQGSAPDHYRRELWEQVRTWAKELGCTRARLQGRPGWIRWDKRFTPVGIVAECEL